MQSFDPKPEDKIKSTVFFNSLETSKDDKVISILKYCNVNLIKFLVEKLNITNIEDFKLLYTNESVHVLRHSNIHNLRFLFDKFKIKDKEDFEKLISTVNTRFAIEYINPNFLATIVESLNIKTIGEFIFLLNEDSTLDLLRYGNKKLTQFLIVKLNITNVNDFKSMLLSANTRYILIEGNKDLISYLIDKLNIHNYNDFNSLTQKGQNCHVLMFGHISSIRHDIESGNISDIAGFTSLCESYQQAKPHKMIKQFEPEEDVPGDTSRINKLIDSVTSQHKIKQPTWIDKIESLFKKDLDAENFKKIIDILSNDIFNRLNKSTNTYSGRPENNKHTTLYTTYLNEIQIDELRDKDLYAQAELLESKKHEGRTLILYFRAGMDGVKFTALTYMLYKYIVLEKRSPVFSKLIITSYSKDKYPKKLHNLDIPQDLYKYGKRNDFRNLVLGGNMVYFTHSNSTESNKFASTPIISQAVRQNQDKFKEGDYVELKAFFGTDDEMSPMKYSAFSEKDRGRDLKRLLGAMMWSVLTLENKLLGKINTYKKGDN